MNVLLGLPRGAGGDDLVQLAAFRIGAEEYAVDIMKIQEIIHPLRITKVPKAPRFVEGVVELRGAILPVVDLRKRFDAPLETTRATKYIIVRLAGRLVGLVVDAVREVLRVPRKEVKPTPEFGAMGKSARFFSGVCHLGERIIMILDLEQLLDVEERRELGADSKQGVA
jgi:purine-binding chemotaxis protein CheW